MVNQNWIDQERDIRAIKFGAQRPFKVPQIWVDAQEKDYYLGQVLYERAGIGMSFDQYVEFMYGDE